MTTVSSRTLDIARDWKVTDYYDRSESDAWTDPFWKPGTQFRDLFEKLDTTSTVELACGHGRHSAYLLSTKRDQTALQSLVLLDVVEENVLHCKERFSGVSEVNVTPTAATISIPLRMGPPRQYSALMRWCILNMTLFCHICRMLLVSSGPVAAHCSIIQIWIKIPVRITKIIPIGGIL